MSWVTVIWSMVASACLTMAAIHLLVWCQRRAVRANLLFSLTSTAIAVYAIIELRLLRAETPTEFATALRWIHVPTWVLTLSLVGFVRLHLRAGRPWLAWTFCGLRTLALLLNFLVGHNLNYTEVTGLRRIPFLGESVSLAEGVSNPWMLVGQLSLLLLLIFTADAAITVWRRGDRRQALVTDEPQFCKALARLLKTHGFEVATFTSGEALLTFCASRLPDCLLLDVHMPGLNGFEILERIATQPMPVLVITGHDQPGNAERLRDLGSSGYFLKPVNESQLLAAIGAAIAHQPPEKPKL